VTLTFDLLTSKFDLSCSCSRGDLCQFALKSVHSFSKKRTFKNNTNYFYAVGICISLAILSEIFIQIGYFLSASLYFSKRGAY